MFTTRSTRFLTLFFLPVCCLLLPPDVSAQSPIDLSVHFSPQLRYVNSEDNTAALAPGATVGNSGLAVGYSFGAAIEYPLLGELYLRAGVDYSHKRHHYRVDRLGNDVRPASSGENTVTYQALEVPVQLLYRFGFKNDTDNFLVGAGVVAASFVGDPRVESSFSGKDLTGFESLVTTGTSWSVFAGYDRYISDRFLLSLEPYLSFSPDRIYLESNSFARVVGEGGVRLRLTLDN